MVNRINFRMGARRSIPIYADWSRNMTLDTNADNLVLIPENNLPVYSAMSLTQPMLSTSILSPSDEVWFEYVWMALSQLLDEMEIDLYRRIMKIGIADPLKIGELDGWNPEDGLRVSLTVS